MHSIAVRITEIMGTLLSINLLQRIVVAVLGIPLFLWINREGGILFFLLVLLLSLQATVEFYRLAEHKAHPSPLWVVLPWTVLLQVNFYTGFADTAELLLLMVLFLFVLELFDKEGSPLLNLGSLLTGLLYVNLCFGSLLRLRISLPDGRGEAFVLLLLVCVWSADIFAYFGGSTMGGKLIRRKLFERLSPHKTWEGFLSGFFGSLAASFVFARFVPDVSDSAALITGALIGLGSPAGDLIESMFKRDAGVKDSSGLIPGHGGVLDRFDTVMFVSPFVYLIITYL